MPGTTRHRVPTGEDSVQKLWSVKKEGFWSPSKTTQEKCLVKVNSKGDTRRFSLFKNKLVIRESRHKGDNRTPSTTNKDDEELLSLKRRTITDFLLTRKKMFGKLQKLNKAMENRYQTLKTVFGLCHQIFVTIFNSRQLTRQEMRKSRL